MDHAVLKPAATVADVRAAAQMCREFGVGQLCVRSCDVTVALEALQGAQTTVAAVVGFPHGAQRSEVKVLEARLALQDGAAELDVVMNIGRFLAGEFEYVREELAAVVEVAHAAGAQVKVIIESCLLTEGQIAQACELGIAAGADYLKSSTGFSDGGATPAVIAQMVACCGQRAQVKASGGIRTWEEACHYLELGATRLGVGAAAQILQ